MCLIVKIESDMKSFLDRKKEAQLQQHPIILKNILISYINAKKNISVIWK